MKQFDHEKQLYTVESCLKCKCAEAEPAFLAGVALLRFVNGSPKYEGNANNY